MSTEDDGMPGTAGGAGEPAGEEPAKRDGAQAFVDAQKAHRLEKLDALRAEGIEPYPVRFDRDHTLGELRERYGSLGPGEETGADVRVAGRISLIRRHGGVVFADIRDRSGTIQLLVAREGVGAPAHDDFRHLDLGDWVGVEGEVIATRRGELSVRVRWWQLLSKSLRALPDKARGLADVDTRFRQRYVDLIVNEDARRVFQIRFATIAAIRRVLTERGFYEVETPVLDTSAGGAAARPFVTHHNALDLEMYLRIALELPLKRLVVGGFERVFEIGRVFRNEGLDTRHNPEFTLLEAYQALADYHDMMELVETLCSTAAMDALGTTVVNVDGREIDLAPPWRRVTLAELVRENAGVEMHPTMPLEEARAIATKLGIPFQSTMGSGALMAEVYEATSEDKLIEPTFVCDYPREISPLARVHRDDPELTERFECIIAGRELANAYSELNDPVDQRQRFEAQAALKAAGDPEAEDIDEDYVRALEYGLPPTGGLGIGLDRLVMLLAGVSTIREVILFPTMRPEDDGRGRRPHTAGLFGGHSPLPRAEELVGPAGVAVAAARDGGEASEAAGPSGAALAPAAGAAPVVLATELPDRRAVKWLAWLTGLGGLLIVPPLVGPLHTKLGIGDDPWLPQGARVVGHILSLVLGIALVVVAFQLARRKRVAFLAAVGLLSLGAIVNVFKGPHPLVVLFCLALILGLVRYREAFRARGDPRSLQAFLWFVPLYLLAVGIFGTVALLRAADNIPQTLTVGGVLETVYGGLVGLDGPYTYEGRFFQDFFSPALLTLGILGVVIAAVLLFRTLRQRGGPTADDRRLATELVRSYGSDSLSYFALRTDKSYFFSSDRRAMIAYTFMSGYALASGDPVGAPGSITLVLDEFMAFCRDRAWHAAFLAVREADLPLYAERGMSSMYLGDEAIIACDTFSLSGGAMKSVRSAVKHVGKDHRCELMRETDASPGLVGELNKISELWRGKAIERGFTMALGEDVEGQEADFLLAVAFDRDEQVAGFLRLVPCYGSDPGYSLDLMRRRPDAANGITEFLIANAALALGDAGFHRLSMNFAPWGRLFEEGGHLTVREKVMKSAATALNPFFQIKSLRDFNQKFAPEWLPRSIIVEDPAAMAKVGVLYASVEGFLQVPVVGSLLVPKAHGETARAGEAAEAAAGVGARAGATASASASASAA